MGNLRAVLYRFRNDDTVGGMEECSNRPMGPTGCKGDETDGVDCDTCANW